MFRICIRGKLAKPIFIRPSRTVLLWLSRKCEGEVVELQLHPYRPQASWSSQGLGLLWLPDSSTSVSRLQAPVHVLLEPDRRGVAAGASAASFSSLREQLRRHVCSARFLLQGDFGVELCKRESPEHPILRSLSQETGGSVLSAAYLAPRLPSFPVSPELHRGGRSGGSRTHGST